MRQREKDVFIHTNALVETNCIGRSTRIWAYVHVLHGAVIGSDCNICDFVFIENDVVLGNNVTVKSGVQLWDGLRIEDDVFIGPNVTFVNDIYPRSKQYLEKFPKTTLKRGASIGANSVILAGLEIGKHAMIGAGAVVTKPVGDYHLVLGNPAIHKGFVCQCGAPVDCSNDLTWEYSCRCGLQYIISDSMMTLTSDE